MRYSLQFRLLVAFTLVILLTIGAVFFMMWQAATGQIQQFGERVERMVGNRIQFVVTDYYLAHGSWEGVQPLVTANRRTVPPQGHTGRCRRQNNRRFNHGNTR